MKSISPEGSARTSPFWDRAARVVSVVMGLIFAAGVVSKLTDWESTRNAMTLYSTLRSVPPALPAAVSLFFEAVIAITLLGTPTWHRWGLPACGAFWAFTGIILAIETIAGSSGDCGCLPFLPRNINWFSAVQNFSTAFFLLALWRLIHLGEGEVTADRTDS